MVLNKQKSMVPCYIYLQTIREKHSSLDGGLSPPPRVVSLEDSRGFKVMTELVDHENR